MTKFTMEGASNQVSMLARQFHDLCQGFNNLIDEFRRFASSHENCQSKWLEAEEEVRKLKSQLHDVSQSKCKLESQYHHTTVLLKKEVKVRTHLQEEKKNLEKKIKLIREKLPGPDNEFTNDYNKQKSKTDYVSPSFASTSAHCNGRTSRADDWLNAISDARSITEMSDVSIDVLEDQKNPEADVSTVRSTRATSCTRREHVSEERHVIKSENSKIHSHSENVHLSKNERVIATTTVSVPKKGGPITATSVIETHPAQVHSGDESASTSKSRRVRVENLVKPETNCLEKPLRRSFARDLSPGEAGKRSTSVPATARIPADITHLRSVNSGSRISQRRHNFSQKTIIKSENCVPCGTRIKFGKPALKCADCRLSCHVDCKSKMPPICAPTMHASFSRCLSGTLADYAPGTSPMIPAIIVYCVNEIERRGMKEVALYRINGAEKEIHDLKDDILKGKALIHQMSIVNIHVITGVLKHFLRSLKEPLITFSLWKSFTSIADMSDEMDVQTTVYSLIPDLPQPNRDTLAYLILHIQRVAESSDCKMPIVNLARIFGPIIVGHSCPDPDVQLTLRETRKQLSTVEKLLHIPSDYWNRFVLEH